MMLWATNLAATDVVLHAAGWLEGGLTAFEKFALDVELLRQFRVQASGIGFSDEELAFDLRETGPGGLFLSSPHTRAHFKEWLYMSPLFQTPDFATWEAMGSETTEVAANRAWKQLLETYEDPGLDPAIDEELLAFMTPRRAHRISTSRTDRASRGSAQAASAKTSRISAASMMSSPR